MLDGLVSQGQWLTIIFPLNDREIIIKPALVVNMFLVTNSPLTRQSSLFIIPLVWHHFLHYHGYYNFVTVAKKSAIVYRHMLEICQGIRWLYYWSPTCQHSSGLHHLMTSHQYLTMLHIAWCWCTRLLCSLSCMYRSLGAHHSATMIGFLFLLRRDEVHKLHSVHSRFASLKTVELHSCIESYSCT